MRLVGILESSSSAERQAAHSDTPWSKSGVEDGLDLQQSAAFHLFLHTFTHPHFLGSRHTHVQALV